MPLGVPPSWIAAVAALQANAAAIDATYNISGKINTAKKHVKDAIEVVLTRVDRFQARQDPLLTKDEKDFFATMPLAQTKIGRTPLLKYVDVVVSAINKEKNWNQKLLIAVQGYDQIYRTIDQQLRASRQLTLTQTIQIDQHNAQAIATRNFWSIVSLPAFVQAQGLQPWQVKAASTANTNFDRWVEKKSYRNMTAEEFMEALSLLRQLVHRMTASVVDIQTRIATGNTP